MKAVLSSVLALAPFLLTSRSSSEEWNQWRGPGRDGTAPASAPVWPESLGEDRLVKLWNVSLAEGYASPVADGGLVYTVETREKEREIVRAFDLETGSAAWEAGWEGSMKVPFFAAKNGSWVRNTPAVFGGAVYVGGMRDVLVKLDAATGAEQWRIDFMERDGTELPAFGHVSSPLPGTDGGLYVQAGCAVAKIEAASGKTLWRALEDRRAMFGSAFSSPVLANLGGKTQLVAQTRSTLGGLDPETGEVLWSTPVEAFRGMNILTPTVIGDNRVFTATYGGGSFLFAVEKGADGSFSVSEQWRLSELEGYMASPVVVDDHLYLFGKDKHLHCVEIATGTVKWTSEEEFGEYWSMVRQGDRILSLDQRGELILLRATPERFELVDRRRVSSDDPTWAHLGIAHDRLLVRSLKGLAVYRWK